jgi:hypothetical protein
MHFPPDEAEALYLARNCLMHSFGLYDARSKTRAAVAVLPKWARGGESPVVRDPTTGRWIVTLQALFRRFLEGVQRYEADVRSGLKGAEFAAMFSNYGWTQLARPTS